MGYIVAFLLIIPVSFGIQWYLFTRTHQWMQTRFPRLPAGVWLFLSMLGTNSVSLAFSEDLPYAGGFLGSPARIHRGWPLPWYGLAGLEVIVTPFTFAITTLIWSVATCLWYGVVTSLTPKTSPLVVKYIFIALASGGIIALSYMIPYLIGSVSPF